MISASEIETGQQPVRWLLLAHQLPSKPAHQRIKAWRCRPSLKAVAVKSSVHAPAHSLAQPERTICHSPLNPASICSRLASFTKVAAARLRPFCRKPDIDLKAARFGRDETGGTSYLVRGLCMASKDDPKRIERGSIVLISAYFGKSRG
jgi:hypothetical protein